MKKHEEALKLRPRLTETIELRIPVDTLTSLQKVGVQRDMSVEALLKFYVGQGLRQDLSRLFAEGLLDRTAEVLARHIGSKDEISAILQEIRLEAVA